MVNPWFYVFICFLYFSDVHLLFYLNAEGREKLEAASET